MHYKVLFMQEKQPPLETLQDIKRMMEKSSRFISLSGWSGISAGVCALIGAAIAYSKIAGSSLRSDDSSNTTTEYILRFGGVNLVNELLWIAIIVFIAAFASAFFFTYLRSKKNNMPMWDLVSRRLLWNLLIPLLAGGACLLRMLQMGFIGFIAPCSLIFYGLSLLNASKYTLGEIRYLGIGQLVLGIVNLWMMGYGLYFWAVGFGLLHIVYGILMWRKYER